MSKPPCVLLIEDNPHTARLLGDALRAASEAFEVAAVSSAHAGLAHLAAHGADVVLLDYRLPDGDGLECLRRLRHRYPQLPVILVTGEGSEEVAVEAMKLGATDYLVKHGRYLVTVPVKVREALGRSALARAAAYYRRALHSERRQVMRLRHELREAYRLEGIVGDSEGIEQALGLAERAAHSRATVLLAGETGTGKELFARAIHYRGRRAGGPFLACNCAAVPEPLLESELFGHVRGAFTGADRAHRGLFEEAHGGTLFLDEVSETSLTLQAKLLRVLQEREIRPVGSAVSRPVDVRVVAAANRDLRTAVLEGRFREDLYYRLNVFPITLPPLRERRSDIALLAIHFLDRLCQEEGKRLAGFSAPALQLLERYPWPGNVRELHNEVHRIVVFAEPGERVTEALLSPPILEHAALGDGTGGQPLHDTVRNVEVALIDTRLREHGYHRGATARSLGVSRESLWAKMRQLGLQPPRRGPS